jgi:Tol biopolymer transport system component
MNDIYRVPAAGGTPMPVTEDRYVNEFDAASSPDGRVVVLGPRHCLRAVVAQGQQPHRRIGVVDGRFRQASAYTRISALQGRQVWPMWSRDGRAPLLCPDRSGAENIWSRPATATGADRVITSFKDGRVLWPSISGDGKTIAFERDFGIWTADTSSGQARAVPIARRGAATTPVPERVGRRISFPISPRARRQEGGVHRARGRLCRVRQRSGRCHARATGTPELESQPVWAPDSRRLAASRRAGAGSQVYLYDFGSGKETALTTGDEVDISPVFSPDGKRLAFLRNRKELRILDFETKQERVAATGMFADALDTPRPAGRPTAPGLRSSPSGRNRSPTSTRNSGGGTPRPVSFLANVFANTLAWSRDGTYLLFDSRQRTEDGQLPASINAAHAEVPRGLVSRPVCRADFDSAGRNPRRRPPR